MLSQTKTVQNVNINDYTECDSVHEQISDFIPPTSICNYKDDDRLSVNYAYRLKLIQMCIVTGLRISNGRHADNLAKDFTYCGANRCCVIDFCIEYPKHFQINTSDLGPLHIKLRMGYTINITLYQPEGTSCNRHDHMRYRWKEDLVI